MKPITCKKCGSCKGGEHEWGEECLCYEFDCDGDSHPVPICTCELHHQPASEDWEKELFSRLVAAFKGHLDKEELSSSGYCIGHLAVIAGDILISERQNAKEEGKQEALREVLKELTPEDTFTSFNVKVAAVRQIINNKLK